MGRACPLWVLSTLFKPCDDSPSGVVCYPLLTNFSCSASSLLMGPDNIVLGSYSKLLPNPFDESGAPLSLYTLSYDHEQLFSCTLGNSKSALLWAPHPHPALAEKVLGFCICYVRSGQRNICPGDPRGIRSKSRLCKGSFQHGADGWRAPALAPPWSVTLPHLLS